LGVFATLLEPAMHDMMSGIQKVWYNETKTKFLMSGIQKVWYNVIWNLYQTRVFELKSACAAFKFVCDIHGIWLKTWESMGAAVEGMAKRFLKKGLFRLTVKIKWSVEEVFLLVLYWRIWMKMIFGKDTNNWAIKNI
jgi:hypothetical protein